MKPLIEELKELLPLPDQTTAGPRWRVVVSKEQLDRILRQLEAAEKLAEALDELMMFVMNITLFLQAFRSKSPEQMTHEFNKADRLYTKYDVEFRKTDPVSTFRASHPKP